MAHIIIPLAASDRPHLQAFIKNLRQMPPAPTDKVLIVPTTEVLKLEDFTIAMDEIRNIFSVENTLIKATPNNPEGGWPQAPNKHFMWGVTFLNEAEKVWGCQPWMWLETDCRFLRSGWSESLQTAYRNGGKPFMGVEVPSIVTLEDKKTKVQSSQTRGTHMMGVGFYPPQYTKGRSGWKFPQKQLSFTIFCQKEHENFQRTKLIAHFARTQNWQRNPDGTFSCEDMPNKHPHEILYGSKSIDLSGVVLVHGEKDGSLAKLILEGPSQVPVFVAEIKPDEALAQLDSLRRENEELRRNYSSLSDKNEQQARVIEDYAFSKLPSPEETANQLTCAALNAEAKNVDFIPALLQENKELKEQLTKMTIHSIEQAQERLTDSGAFKGTSLPPSGFLPSPKMVSDCLEQGSMTLPKMAEYFECRDIPAFEEHLASLGYEAPKPHRRVRLIQLTEGKTIKKVAKKVAATA